MSKSTTSILAALEALLFIYGEPITVKKLAALLKKEEKLVTESLQEFETQLTQDNRGLSLFHHDGKIQLVTKPDFSHLLESITKEEFDEELTPATLETLSIVMYAGPVSRADIEYIRGVNSSFILRALLMRGLIDRSIDPKRANAYLYNPHFDLLKKLGVSQAALLPEYEKYNGLIKKLYEETKATPAHATDKQAKSE
ncbi:MAG TPA: SMC-Scp complex subunit ScpB [Candidatus Paceibacterota bacterium]